MMTQVPSRHTPQHVQTSGFELAGEAAHMLAWLGKGETSEQFVVHDIEDGIYRQAPDGQVLEVRCNDKPELTTEWVTEDGPHDPASGGFRVTFPLTVRVRSADGVYGSSTCSTPMRPPTAAPATAKPTCARTSRCGRMSRRSEGVEAMITQAQATK